MNSIGHFHCDNELLERLVRDELPAAQAEDVHEHLNECTTCAMQLQTIASEKWPWEKVAGCLLPDELDSRQDAESLSILGYTTPGDGGPVDQSMLSREISGWLDATDDPSMLGRFAGYEITGIIGHGGMGIVLKGFEASLNRYVAIKVLAPRLATNGAARRRFSREAQAAAAVRHDNVIAVHRVDQWHGLPFLVMPYVAGISLQKRIDSEGPLSTEACLRIASQVAAGLAAAHAQGLVHRDIKPANILLDQGVERVTITDFGLARAVDDASITRTGVIAGTPQFMSPEQAQCKPLDHRSDLFSLGSLVYAMATGRPPFRGDGNADVLEKIVSQQPRGVREIEPSVPQWLVEIIDWLHAKSPNSRPQRAIEVADLLEKWLAHLQQPDSVPEPKRVTPATQSTIRKPSSRWRRNVAAMAGGAILILAAVIIILETGKGTTRIDNQLDSDSALNADEPNATQSQAEDALSSNENVEPEGIRGKQGENGYVESDQAEAEFATMTQRLSDYVIERAEKNITMNAPEFLLHKEPLLRWSNQHRATRDGATYLWTYEDRPAVIMSPYWAWNGKGYSHEFQSLHSRPFVVKLDGEVVWAPQQAGLTFQADPEERDVSSDRVERLAQMKSIATSFTANGGTIESPRWGLPLLPEPIYRYGDASDATGVIDGAVFAFALDSDPELLLLIEANPHVGGEQTWQIAFARMAVAAMFVRHQGEVIWKVGRGQPWDRKSPYFSIETRMGSTDGVQASDRKDVADSPHSDGQ